MDIDAVSVRLGDVDAVREVSATVERGQFVGVVGPNGAGKTTLLRTLTAALTPRTGRVRIEGEDVHARSSRAVSRKVAVVPQDTSLTFDFEVREIVSMGRTPYLSRLGRRTRADDEAVERAMEQTRVARFATRPISEISGGERQRVLLARALAQDTPLLLLDEPTASLDINHQIRTFELVRELLGEDKTVLAAIHDLNLAAHYCDELLLLGDGRLLASGTPATVLTEANLERAFGTRAVVSRHPVTGSVYVTALPEVSRKSAAGRVHVVGGGGNAARILYVLSVAGYDVSVGAMNQGDADLETARLLGLDAVSVAPFAPVDDTARREVERRVAAADVTVVADVEVGTGNLANLEVAKSSDSVVIVEQRPFDERNFAGPDARAVYERLRERGTVVPPNDVLGAVTDLVDAASTPSRTGCDGDSRGVR
ncbi:MAG: heme ABC transporter ATP-binding protein [Halobacteriota archaeon]